MNDTTSKAAEPAKARMDRSRAFAEVHGDRVPGDRHANVFFYQDGLPFDAQGFLLSDHPEVKASEKLQQLAERRLKKAADHAAKHPAPKPKATEAGVDSDDGDDGEPQADDGLLDPINLEAWLRGEQEVEWQEVSQEIARAFKRRFANERDAVEFLVKEMKVVPKGLLRRKFQKYVD